MFNLNTFSVNIKIIIDILERINTVWGEDRMRTVAIGKQNYESVIKGEYFYVDKTGFIKEWWESGDDVTLIIRPRRFGKTLNMSMIECFFSLKYANRDDLFEGLSIYEEEKYRELQGTYPVISLSFANVKETNFQSTREKICQVLTSLYIQNSFLRDSDVLTDKDREYFDRISVDMRDSDATMALHQLSDYLCRYYGKKVIILLDEYDTPMQEAYVDGYWEELVAFTRSLFNATFKTNPYLERAIMTGITRVSKESIFSDLNNLKVVTTTADEYATAFGFTQQEVFAAMDEFGLQQKDEVKYWYDGFVFGNVTDIYNPWSILNYLDTGMLNVYWANTSGNALVNSLLQKGSPDVKEDFQTLLQGGSVHKVIDEQIVYSQLSHDENAIWSLLLASGYLRLKNSVIYGYTECDMVLTNYEVKLMFQNMVRGWFRSRQYEYNSFIKALLKGDCKAMNAYMNKVAMETFSYFDTGREPSLLEPERFYHGFVLGLLVDLQGRYSVTSNRESGFGRYDVMLEPLNETDDAIILEFKVHDSDEEQDLKATVQSALRQIDEQQYEANLCAKGMEQKRIRKYGFAFRGKEVLIGN